MAKSKDNVVMQGASGRVGRNLVFRQRGDETIIARRPRQKPGKQYTADQKMVMNNFTRAALYAKATIDDPQLKEAYKAKTNNNQTAYNMAFRDYLVKPEVALLDDINYEGNVGDMLTFLVKDVLKVKTITVEILDQDDNLIESGQAQPVDSRNTQWKYIATADNPDYLTSKYRISMLDTPNKRTVVLKAYGEDE